MKNPHIGVVISLLVLIFDQWSKLMMQGILKATEAGFIPLIPFLDVIAVWNQGITFGMFNESALSKYIFVIVTITIVGVLSVWLLRSNSRLQSVAIGMVIGGAIGNMIDRLRFGAVFDFIGVYANFGGRKLYWPIFNVADSFICIGAGLLALYILLVEKEKGKKHQ